MILEKKTVQVAEGKGYHSCKWIFCTNVWPKTQFHFCASARCISVQHNILTLHLHFINICLPIPHYMDVYIQFRSQHSILNSTQFNFVTSCKEHTLLPNTGIKYSRIKCWQPKTNMPNSLQSWIYGRLYNSSHNYFCVEYNYASSHACTLSCMHIPSWIGKLAKYTNSIQLVLLKVG